MLPASVNALIFPFQHDHPAGVGGVELRSARDRLVLRGVALAVVCGQRQFVAFAHLALIAQAGLGLVERFAGVVLIRARCLAWVFFPFRLGQAARIAGVNRDAVEHQRQGADVVQPHAELAVAEVFPRGAVIAVALGGKAGAGEGVVNVAGLGAVAGGAGCFHPVAPGVVAAEIAAGFQRRRLGAGYRINVDDPARGVAVQRGIGAAQYLDAFDGIDVNVGGLPLAVGHGGGNTVDVHAHPAHAEHRTAAEAAYRQLQILRIVLPILELQARHAAEIFRQVNLRGGVAQILAVDHVDGNRRSQLSEAGRLRHHHQGVALFFSFSAADAWPMNMGCSNSIAAGVSTALFLLVMG